MRQKGKISVNQREKDAVHKSLIGKDKNILQLICRNKPERLTQNKIKWGLFSKNSIKYPSISKQEKVLE